MQRETNIRLAVVTACIQADVVALNAAPIAMKYDANDCLVVVIYALAFSQITAAAIWLVFGSAYFARRILVSAAALGGWLWVAGFDHLGVELYLLLFCQIVALAGLCRAMGGRVELAERQVVAASSQFSIRQLLWLTTTAAVLLGAGRYFVARGTTLSETPLSTLALAASPSAVGLLATWLVFGRGPAAWRLISLAVGIAAASWFANRLVGWTEFYWFVVGFVIQSALIVAMSLGHRLLGYRLRFVSRTRPSDGNKTATPVAATGDAL